MQNQYSNWEQPKIFDWRFGVPGAAALLTVAIGAGILSYKSCNAPHYQDNPNPPTIQENQQPLTHNKPITNDSGLTDRLNEINQNKHLRLK